MQEKEKIHSGKERKNEPRASSVHVSLDRADAIIEGGAPLCGFQRVRVLSVPFLAIPYETEYPMRIRVLPALSVAEGSERRELKDLSPNLRYLRHLEISLKLIIR